MTVGSYKARWTIGTVGTVAVLGLSAYLWAGNNDALYGLLEGLIALVIGGIVGTIAANYAQSENLGLSFYLLTAAVIAVYLSTGVSPNEDEIITIYEPASEPGHIDLREICIKGPDGVTRCRPHGL